MDEDMVCVRCVAQRQWCSSHLVYTCEEDACVLVSFSTSDFCESTLELSLLAVPALALL